MKPKQNNIYAFFVFVIDTFPGKQFMDKFMLNGQTEYGFQHTAVMPKCQLVINRL